MNRIKTDTVTRFSRYLSYKLAIFISMFSCNLAIAGPTPITFGNADLTNSLGSVGLPLVFQPGDSVEVSATAMSNDPDENGENEPLNVVMNGGQASQQSYSIPSYNIANSLAFTVTTPNSTITAYFTGGDEDETAHLQYAVNAPVPLNVKNSADSIASGLSTINEVLGAASTAACSVTVPGPLAEACAGLSVISLVSTAAEWGSNLVASDPPDSNYKVIATPTPVPYTPLSSQDTTAQTTNSLASNLSTAAGLMQAIYTSLNRAQGAEMAGDNLSTAQQLNAAQQYFDQLTALLQQEPTLLSAWEQVLSADGINLAITPLTIEQFESSLANSGLPSNLVQYLEGLGLTTADITQILDSLIVEDPSIFDGTFPEILSNFSLNGTQLASVPEPRTVLIVLSGLLFLASIASIRKRFAS